MTLHSMKLRALNQVIYPTVTALLFSLFTATSSAAPNLVTINDPITNEITSLLGATEVSVGNSLFDVEFFDGTYVDLFPSGSLFTTESEARSASTALLNLFNDPNTPDIVTESPEITRGITRLNVGVIRTPFGAPYQAMFQGSIDTVVKVSAFQNRQDAEVDSVVDTLEVSATTNRLARIVAYAVWTPSISISAVPEPSTYAMMGLGLLAVVGISRRKNQA